MFKFSGEAPRIGVFPTRKVPSAFDPGSTSFQPIDGFVLTSSLFH